MELVQFVLGILSLLFLQPLLLSLAALLPFLTTASCSQIPHSQDKGRILGCNLQVMLAFSRGILC